MTKISGQFLISGQFQDNFKISGISEISGQLGALLLCACYNLTNNIPAAWPKWSMTRQQNRWHTSKTVETESILSYFQTVLLPNLFYSQLAISMKGSFLLPTGKLLKVAEDQSRTTGLWTDDNESLMILGWVINDHILINSITAHCGSVASANAGYTSNVVAAVM